MATRMRNQRLSGRGMATPEDVVGWLGAVQSQDFGPACWSLGQRLRNGDERSILAAFNAGTFLRTHALRPTWHFLAATDLRWIQKLTGPRVRAANAGRYRQLGLDKNDLQRSCRVIARALRGSNFLMRKEISQVLGKGGVNTEGQRLAYILMHAELEGLICSGPLSGKQHTYALVEERVLDDIELSRDDALAELTRRYFTSHGPATPKDFAWWSGLKLNDVRRGLEMVSDEFREDELDGLELWLRKGRRTARHTAPRVHLVQTYDESIVAYRDSRRLLDIAREDTIVGGFPPFNGAIIAEGRLVGYWKRRFTKDTVEIEAALHHHIPSTLLGELETAAARYAAFVEADPTLNITYRETPGSATVLRS